MDNNQYSCTTIYYSLVITQAIMSAISLFRKIFWLAVIFLRQATYIWVKSKAQKQADEACAGGAYVTSLPILFQTPILASRNDEQSTLVHNPADLERLKRLLPEIAHLDLQEHALTYAEHYQGDILSLEHEWDFLTTAQMRAWQQEEYEVVVRLTSALAYPAGRRIHLAEAIQVLQLGIEASRYLADTHHQASFLNRQGGLMVARGYYGQGQQLWFTGVQLAKSTGAWPLLWEPLASFAYSADILGNEGDTQQFIELLQATHQHADSASLAAVLFIRGFFARVHQRLDKAYEDLGACLQLLQVNPNMSITPSLQLFRVVVQAELARVQEQYARAQIYTETALALAQAYGDHYTLGTLLIDQAIFTYRQSQFADTRVAFLRLRELAQHLETPHFRERSHVFEQRLREDEQSQRAQPKLLTILQTPTGLHEPLSTREEEVLQLVTKGLSNREIAQHLVITPSTVKKHLEHIYAKLDTHSRTSTIARARALNIID